MREPTGPPPIVGEQYLVCSRCGLSIRVRFSAMAPEHCPRCLARAKALHPLFPSPLPYDALKAESRQPPERVPTPDSPSMAED
jgi:hypothetical protein